jgi:hypothetical protein
VLAVLELPFLVRAQGDPEHACDGLAIRTARVEGEKHQIIGVHLQQSRSERIGRP